MADNVRRVLEEMVPELEDLEQRGYFSKNEIKQIVQKRQDFEYNLRRRATLKVDFLRYIDYENKLEKLRQLRRKQRGIEGPSTLADHCIVRRTHFIFERALRKFRGDLSLWSRWLKFCQDSKSTRQMSRVLTRALQLHPNCASLWTYAAAWEFEHNANAVAARALMQRGIRMCKDAPSLWHEYFRMELLYAARLVARRQVLGLAIDNTTDGTTIEQDAAAALVLKGAVAKVVYNSAIDTIKDSLEFRAGFLEVLQSVDLPAKEELENFILNDIAAVFGDTPGAVALQAQRAMHAAAAEALEEEENNNILSLSAIQAGVEVFLSYLEKSPSQLLFDKLVEFLEGHIETALKSGEKGEDDESGGQIAALLVQECINVITKAKESGYASPHAVLTLTRAHLRLGQLKEALNSVADARSVEINSLNSVDALAAIERQHMGLHATAASLEIAGATAAPTVAVLERALRNSSEAGRRVELWYAALRIAVASNEALDLFGKLLLEQQSGSAKGPVVGGMGGPAAALFTSIWTTVGPRRARKLYHALFAVPSPGGELVHAVLDAELALLQANAPSIGGSGADVGSSLSLTRIREIFEAGVAAHGHIDEDLWLRYLKFEQMHEGGKKVGSIHWRAVKALEAPDAFVARAHLIASGTVAA